MTVQVCISYRFVLMDQLSALPCVHEVGIFPSLRRKEKLDVHRNPSPNCVGGPCGQIVIRNF